MFLNPCALNMSVSALACAIAEGKSDAELALLACFFTQLGDSMETILAARGCLCPEKGLPSQTSIEQSQG